MALAPANLILQRLYRSKHHTNNTFLKSQLAGYNVMTKIVSSGYPLGLVEYLDN